MWCSRSNNTKILHAPRAGTIAVEQVEPRTVQVGDLTVKLQRWYRLPSHDVRRGRLEAATFAVSDFTVRSTEPKSGRIRWWSCLFCVLNGIDGRPEMLGGVRGQLLLIGRFSREPILGENTHRVV
jgi:hypothetical protein